MRYGSVCSGIEAASVAWEPLGWQASWFSEIEKFPSAVLSHHWPDVQNLGDMLALPDAVASGEVEAPDVLVGGTPCQAFSLAGRRGSLEDERGALTLAFVELANRIDDQRKQNGQQQSIIVWENVPGVLSTRDNAFGAFLAGIAGETVPLVPTGPRWTNAGCVLGPQRTVAWRVLDAQHFGVAQRRRRVFVVASARGGFDPAEVLFEFEGVRRDSAPSREAGKDASADAGPGAEKAGWPASIASTLNAAFGSKLGLEDQHINSGAPLFVPGAVRPFATRDVAQTVTSNYGKQIDNTDSSLGPNCAVQNGMAVRRLTPVECERLQGFPDNHTMVPYRNKPAADGPRYKAIGNSMAVPVMRWIGERIDRYCT